jgi:hypothetical protein
MGKPRLVSPMEDLKKRIKEPEGRIRTKSTGKWWSDARRRVVVEGLAEAANSTRLGIRSTLAAFSLQF